jgi:hypothetical protein
LLKYNKFLELHVFGVFSRHKNGSQGLHNWSPVLAGNTNVVHSITSTTNETMQVSHSMKISL